MFDLNLFLDVFVALFAVLNPLLAIPLFLSLTADDSMSERQRVAVVASMTVGVALCVAALIGDRLLILFGINLPSFQVAGGIVLLTIALGMLKREPEPAQREIGRDVGQAHRDIAIYPLAIPLFAGPGAFVTTIVFSSRVASLGDFLTLCTGIGAIVVVIWLSLVFAAPASRLLGRTAISIVTPLLGILLAAVAIELVFAGLDRHVLDLLSLIQS